MLQALQLAPTAVLVIFAQQAPPLRSRTHVLGERTAARALQAAVAAAGALTLLLVPQLVWAAFLGPTLQLALALAVSARVALTPQLAQAPAVSAQPVASLPMVPAPAASALLDATLPPRVPPLLPFASLVVRDLTVPRAQVTAPSRQLPAR